MGYYEMKTQDSMGYYEMKTEELLEIQRKSYQSVDNGGILLDHFMSLKHGLRLIDSAYLFFHWESSKRVKEKVYSLTHLRKDECLFTKLDREYSHLREQMKNFIIKPGTNKFYEEFYFEEMELDTESEKLLEKASLLLCEIIEELVSSDSKADQIRPVKKELEDIRNMLSLLEPFFQYEKHASHFLYHYQHEKEKNILCTVAAMMERVICFVYLSAVGKMDDEMVISLKSISSDLIIEESQIMEMYHSLDVDSIRNLKSHISMSLRLLGWNKRCYLGTELGEALEDHFISIEHGLQYLVQIIEVSENKDLKLRVLRIIKIVKQKLYSLPHNQNDENLKVNLECAYGELRKEMKNVVIKPGTDDYDTLFPMILEPNECLLLEDIMELTSLKLTSSSKASQIAPMMKEIKRLRKKLRSLKPLFNFISGSEKIIIKVALTDLLERATCLVYLSMVAMLNEDMFVSLMKNFSLLIEETEIKKMSLDLGITFEDDLESDIDISLSLMQRHQKYHKYTINEAMLEDHIISLKHGIEFLKWFINIYNFDDDLKHCMILLAGNVKQKLELLTYKQEDESLNMDVNGAYVVLREEMKNTIISKIADKYDSLYPKLTPFDLEKIMKDYLRSNYDFLVDKITTLVTSNVKAGRIAPLEKELQDLRKRLKIFKPLGVFICGIADWRHEKQILKTLLTFFHKAAFLIYLTFVGTMDMEMAISVKSSVSTAIEETDDVQEIYTLILNQFLSEYKYEVKELYLLENLMILLEYNVESLNEGNSKLLEVLMDIHRFLLALPPNVILRKLHLLKKSFEDILRHSIPIIYSCYLVPTKADISAEFKCVLDLIKHIKSEAIETKLYYFPRVDDLGYLEFLLGYLEEKLSMKEEIDALHVEVDALLSLAKSRNQEAFHKYPWNDIINLAYQAEYIVDMYLVSSPRDSGLISSLSKIIERLKNIRADVTWDFSPRSQSLPPQDVATETSKPQVRDNDGIVGLQKETKNITEHLLKGENKLNVVAITGMAGVGKTTLALTLYNTPSMAHHFDIRAQCAVSQSYQLRSLLVSILDQVSTDKNHTSISDNEGLGNHLYKRLKKRRYLVILDDVWDTTLWKDLKCYLPDDSNGSRILITTRNWDVADKIGSKVNELHGLSDENSWELFQKKMLQIECLSDDLLTISKGVVKNCKGLPLSVVIVAGILSSIERTQEKWNQIAESVNSFVLSDPQGNCRAILELSYNNLPNHLRSCFLYLGSFPEDEEISVNRLILLWIGEGFVQDTKIDTAEEVARKYLEDLIVKSLVIPAKKRSGGGVKTFRLHDLMRDFCLGKAKEKHFFSLLGDEAFSERSHPLALQDPRRIIMSGPKYRGSKKMVDFSFHSVRSMIRCGELEAFEIKKTIGSCDMVLLRVLEVHQVRNDFLGTGDHFPDISSLVHLRYLCFDFDYTSILPSTISRLQNLEILILPTVDVKIPDFVWDMVKLRHIHIDKASFEVDSNRLQNSSVLLENLKSLSVARVSYGDSKWLSKLSGLERLHCLFTIDDLKVDDVKEVEDTEMDDATEVDDDVQDNRSRMLGFNGTLISLKVKNRIGREQRFTSTCRLPKSLRKLKMSKFNLGSNDFSIIGKAVPHLEVFKIRDCSVPSGYEWNVDDDDFPELKVLKLRNLKISKWTVSEDSFPILEQLWVDECYSLDEIPLEFGYLPNLRLISVRACAPSVDDSAREIEKMQHEEQNTEMRIHISKWVYDDGF